MRLRHNPEARTILEQSKYVINTFPFKLIGDVVLEIGMGKGEMLEGLALENPKITYIGVEKYATVAEKALKKAKKLKNGNFLIINQDISDLPDILVGKTKTIWLTFSDPWPKARHEKRRLTYKTFLDLYKKILDKNGVIKLKTDNDKFFQYSLNSFKENKWILSNVTRDFHKESFSKGNIKTGYEIKWSEKGKKINYLEAKII